MSNHNLNVSLVEENARTEKKWGGNSMKRKSNVGSSEQWPRVFMWGKKKKFVTEDGEHVWKGEGKRVWESNE